MEISSTSLINFCSQIFCFWTHIPPSGWTVVTEAPRYMLPRPAYYEDASIAGSTGFCSQPKVTSFY